MARSLLKQAYAAFKAGDYDVAKSLYKQLGDLIGEKFFRANIELCQRRSEKHIFQKDYSEHLLKAVKIACVMDAFTYHSYDPECNLLQLTPTNAIDELEAFNPDLLFIESAWRGKDDLWNRKISSLSSELKAVLAWCKQRGVPTVFWNKEDPVHFETFLTTAQQFDYVFTTDIDCIARYKAMLGHDRVFLLPFACQPKTHNPIERYPRKDAFCFAGAYYVRYPDRIRDLDSFIAEFPKFKPVEIFDRNYGKDDVNYQFPPKYHTYIVGTLPFSEIDKAYKGYRYAINLNSIKQSQSMFARRVYELLASNTVTVSNFSRGVRLMFGDLVITSDSGKEIVDRLQRLSSEDEQKIRLTALRKIMLEHTYAHRLSYVLSKVLHRIAPLHLPPMLVVGVAQTETECAVLIENFRRQSYTNKRLLLVADASLCAEAMHMIKDDAITRVSSFEQAGVEMTANIGTSTWLAPMVSADYYGPNYLLDIALASRYSTSDLIGKAAFYQYGQTISLINADCSYQYVKNLALRASATRLAALSQEMLVKPVWLGNLKNECWTQDGLSIDPFNYCRDGGLQSADSKAVSARVDDLTIDTGLPCEQLLRIAENIGAAKRKESDLAHWSSARLHQLVKASHSQIRFNLVDGLLSISSNLPDDKHQYLYSTDDVQLASLTTSCELKTYLEASPGLDVQYAFIFLDAFKKKISHAILSANRNYTTQVPAGAVFVRFGWRVKGSGTASIQSLLWGHQQTEPAQIIGKGKYLLLTNHYPAYDDLYRNGFVHTRVRAYADNGVKIDVFCLRKNQTVSYREFDNIDCITGSQQALHRLLSSGRYKTVLVHFLDPDMWEVLRNYIGTLKVVVWVHGAEIQPWYRRDFNYATAQEQQAARIKSDARMAFWRELLQPIPPNFKLVFVSRYFAEEVMEDLGFRLPEQAYTVIHNPIDTDLFSYQPKPLDMRKKILSIRPYASQKYANDLSVKAIMELSKESFFPELEFRMIGNGKLFDRILDPLSQFPNVKIEQRFLRHEEIAKLHKKYGVFLCPTRMDAQGVSRDEAMASGLVPVTNAVAAIPEFVDENCGILAPAENYMAMAAGISDLYRNPDKFQAMSKAAAERVRRQSSKIDVIKQELILLDSNL